MTDKVDEIRREHFGMSDDGFRVVEGDVVRATKDELHVKRGERYEVLEVVTNGWLKLLGIPGLYASSIFRACFDEESDMHVTSHDDYMGQGWVEFYARPAPKPDGDPADGDRTVVRSLEADEQEAIDAAKQDCEGVKTLEETIEAAINRVGKRTDEEREEFFKTQKRKAKLRAELETGDRERQRMQLVDGFPGEWRWKGGEWRLLLLDDGWAYPINALIHGEDGTAVVGSIVTGSARDAHQLPNTQVLGDTFYEVARALKPKAERLVACLEGLGDE